MDDDRDGVPAPGLAEVAGVWWDVERVPHVRWRAGGTTYVLVDPAGEGDELHLARLSTPPDDPAAFARVLAEGLAACDFPPSDTRAAPGRVAATLRAAGRTETLAT